MDRKHIELMNLFRRGDREKLMVWIGKNGCAVHGGEHAYETSALICYHFINRHRLHEIERREDGLLYAA